MKDIVMQIENLSTSLTIKNTYRITLTDFDAVSINGKSVKLVNILHKIIALSIPNNVLLKQKTVFKRLRGQR